jgi:hypothetical protein
MTSTQPLLEAMRTLLLPLNPAYEPAALEALSAAIANRVTKDDQSDWLRLEMARWRDGGTAASELRKAVKAALKAGDPELGDEIAKAYLEAHKKLRAPDRLSFDEASAFLSHLRLIMSLATEEQLSAAQIARVLSALDQRTPFHWKRVQDVLKTLKLAPELDDDAVTTLLEDDANAEETLFADADVESAASMIGGVAGSLGFPRDMEQILLRLVDPSLSMTGPYLKMLMYQAIICEFYDHAVTVLYEFEPRGALALTVFNEVLGALEGGETTFLDNAKAVDRISLDWTRTRKNAAQRVRAVALVQALEGLEQMPFAARRELASWLRRWVLRILRLAEHVTVPIPAAPTLAQAQSLLTRLASGQTQTSGVIEQRVVDAVATLLHPEPAGWRSHGLGDSVNASNIGRRKTGDCEFQHTAERTIASYESHGGRLSNVYVQSHLRTLRSVIPLRLEEFERVADAREWKVAIFFVAHSLEKDVKPVTETICGVHIEITPITFEALFAQVPPNEALAAVIAERVNTLLNEQRTPQRIRDKYIALTA